MKNVSVKLLFVLQVMALVLATPFAYADKVEKIQKAMQLQCSEQVNPKKALTLIRPLFLTCVPGTMVQVGQCDIRCLKGNGGMVLGRQ